MISPTIIYMERQLVVRKYYKMAHHSHSRPPDWVLEIRNALMAASTGDQALLVTISPALT
jgi:hypothetical protein